jgi:hemerythrin-like domain-containing protein
MKPSEVRDTLLDDHADLRRRLSSVRAELDRDHRDVARDALLDLLDALGRHVDREDKLLPQVLLEDFAFGEERLAALFAHHREQREQIARWRAALELVDAVGTTYEAVVEELLPDMSNEERDLLNDDAIRDDVVQVSFGG